jgi:hypothetical protein
MGLGATRAVPAGLRTFVVVTVLVGALVASPMAAPWGHDPAGGANAGRSAWLLPTSLTVADAPVLSLVPSPDVGNAPLEVNVTVSISGGVAPYNLSVCFGTVDHTSPAPNCGVGAPAWNGSQPLVFSHVYGTPGNFSVVAVATDAHAAGVGSTALIVVTDQTGLGANAVELSGSGTAPLTVTFNESVAGGTPPITLQWTFGDGTSGSELPGVPVRHVYDTVGTYQPVLTVTDGAGHRTVRTLPSITVSAAAGGGSFGTGANPLLALLAAFGVSAIMAAAGVRVAQLRRWRREGEELVTRLEAEPPSSPPPALP